MTAVDDPRPLSLQSATWSTYVAFFGSGFMFASWASRIPQVKAELGLSSSALGLVLLSLAAGSVVSLPMTGALVSRFGARNLLRAMVVLYSLAVVVVSLGVLWAVAPVVVGLFLFGFANGAWDVAMNIHGAAVEQGLRRAIMARFHAGFSVGTVGGAAVGAAAVALHISVTAHLLAVALVVCGSVFWFAGRFVDFSDSADDEVVEPGGHWLAWTEPRTLLIGLFVLAFAFAEGSANDWLSLAMIDNYKVPAAVGTLAFATFLTGMTVMRWFGVLLLERFGRVSLLRTLAVVAAAGMLLFIFGPNAPTAFVGALFWGAGTSLGFPTGMSAAADAPAQAAGRVSVVASISYCAFLAGPPVIGIIGQAETLIKALLLTAGLVGMAIFITGAVKPLNDQADEVFDAK